MPGMTLAGSTWRAGVTGQGRQSPRDTLATAPRPPLTRWRRASCHNTMRPLTRTNFRHVWREKERMCETGDSMGRAEMSLELCDDESG